MKRLVVILAPMLFACGALEQTNGQSDQKNKPVATASSGPSGATGATGATGGSAATGTILAQTATSEAVACSATASKSLPAQYVLTCTIMTKCPADGTTIKLSPTPLGGKVEYFPAGTKQPAETAVYDAATDAMKLPAAACATVGAVYTVQYTEGDDAGVPAKGPCELTGTYREGNEDVPWNTYELVIPASQQAFARAEVDAACKAKFGGLGAFDFLKMANDELRAKSCTLASFASGVCAPCASDSTDCPCTEDTFGPGWVACRGASTNAKPTDGSCSFGWFANADKICEEIFSPCESDRPQGASTKAECEAATQ